MGMMGTKSLTPYKKCEQHKGRSALPLRLLKNVRSKELNTHYDYGKVKYYAKEKTMVNLIPMDGITLPFHGYCNLMTL